jgi:DNA-binding transcriptional regulator YiaG
MFMDRAAINALIARRAASQPGRVVELRAAKQLAGGELPAVEPLTPAEVQAIRLSLGVSQSVFGVLLNADTSTVQNWEQGRFPPEGPALYLLHRIRVEGLSFFLPGA